MNSRVWTRRLCAGAAALALTAFPAVAHAQESDGSRLGGGAVVNPAFNLDELQTTLDDTAARYGKPIVLAETAYPWTLTSGDPTASLSFSTASELETGYAATPAGQQAMFRDTLSIVQAVPNDLGLGAFYWEPAWTVVKGNGWDPTDPNSGDGWENQAMFDYSDTALPVISDYPPR